MRIMFDFLKCVFFNTIETSVLFVNINFQMPYSHCVVNSAISKSKLYVTSNASIIITRKHYVIHYVVGIHSKNIS